MMQPSSDEGASRIVDFLNDHRMMNKNVARNVCQLSGTNTATLCAKSVLRKEAEMQRGLAGGKGVRCMPEVSIHAMPSPATAMDHSVPCVHFEGRQAAESSCVVILESWRSLGIETQLALMLLHHRG